MLSVHKKFIESAGRCEMCGSRRNLQLHHIIPMVCENGSMDLDVEDNWICVCSSCHAKLTPKNLLTKYGLRKKFPTTNPKYKFYKELNELAEAGEKLCVCDVLNVFDKYFFSGKG